MKTTVYIRDELYRRAKAQAALEGKSLRVFLDEALEAMIERSTKRAQRQGHWLDRLPRVPKAAARKVDEVINGPDFRRVDPEMWQ